MDWRGRWTEREVKLHILFNRSAPRFLQWICLVEGLNASERVAKYNTHSGRDARRQRRFLQWIGLVERLNAS